VVRVEATDILPCRIPRTGGPAVVHTLDIDMTVLKARSNNRGVDGERVDNLAASLRGSIPLPDPVVATWSGTFGLGAPFPAPRAERPSPPSRRDG
jgi:hypothetical protein